MTVTTTRYQLATVPDRLDLATTYFGFEPQTEHHPLVTLSIYDGSQSNTYDLPCYFDHFKRSGLVDGKLLDARRAEYYLQGYCRGIPFRGDHGDDYPIRCVVSYLDQTGWLDFNVKP